MRSLPRRYAWLPLLAGLFLALGYCRLPLFAWLEAHWGAVGSDKVPLPLHPRDIAQGLRHNSRWLATLGYETCFAWLAAALVAVWFGNWRKGAFTLGIYSALMLLCFGLILLGSATNNVALGYGLARHLRNWLESPFLLMLLLLALRQFNHPNPA